MHFTLRVVQIALATLSALIIASICARCGPFHFNLRMPGIAVDVQSAEEIIRTDTTATPVVIPTIDSSGVDKSPTCPDSARAI